MKVFCKINWTIAFLMSVLMVIVHTVTLGQLYPVQASVQLSPTYSPYLTDYSAAGSQKLALYLAANDISITDFPVKFRLIKLLLFSILYSVNRCFQGVPGQ